MEHTICAACQRLSHPLPSLSIAVGDKPRAKKKLPAPDFNQRESGLIPPSARLYQRSFRVEEPRDTPLLNSLLLWHCFSTRSVRFLPDKLPGASKSFCGLIPMIVGIVVLRNTTLEVIGGPAIVPPRGFALQDVYPEGHNQKPRLEAAPDISSRAGLAFRVRGGG